MSTTFDVHGVRVRVTCEHAELYQRISDQLACHRSVEGEGGEHLSVDIGYRAAVVYPVPLHARLILRYGHLRLYYLNGRSYFTDYFSTLTVDPGGSRVHGNLDPGSDRGGGMDFFTNVIFPLSLFEALRYHGLYYLHAACLEGPDGTGYLISGNAGSGKTTLTLSLIHNGFRFLSDDTVFLRLGNENSIEILGFARQFHVPLDLVTDNASFEKLKALPDYKPHSRKKMLPPDEWYPEHRIERMKNPRCLIFPRLASNETRLEPINSSEVMTEILGQSPAVMFNLELAPAHLEALKKLIAHGRGFRLISSPDLKTNPERVRRIFEQARDMAGPGEKS